MTYVLNNADVLPVPARAKTVATADQSSLWQRLYDRLIESRSRSALRELHRHAPNLLREAEMVTGGYARTTLRNDADLPFNR